MTVLSNLSLKIFQTEFYGDTGYVPESYIEAWLNENLGQLNARINTCFSGSGAPLDLEAQAIYKEMYMENYYRKQARNALRGLVGGAGGTSAGNGVLSLRDGNSSVSFTNKNEVSKVYNTMANDCDEKIKELSHQYNMYQSSPWQLGGIEAEDC